MKHVICVEITLHKDYEGYIHVSVYDANFQEYLDGYAFTDIEKAKEVIKKYKADENYRVDEIKDYDKLLE